MPTDHPGAEGAPEVDSFASPEDVSGPAADTATLPDGAVAGAAGAKPQPRTLTGASIFLVVALAAVSVGLIFQGGSYGPSTWLPWMMGVAALGLVVTIAGPPAFSGRFQKVLLALFLAQAAWTAASVLWASSLSNAWEETNRTGFYAIAIILVFVALRWAGATGLKALGTSVAALSGIVALVAIITLAVTGEPAELFADGRLNYPVTYYNGLAALLMIGFWVALGMANAARCTPKKEATTSTGDPGSEESEMVASRVASRRSRGKASAADRLPRWTQPLLLALSVVLLETAVLPQSRGALWAFFLVVPFFVLFSSNRFRALVDLAIVVVPVLLFWDWLNGPYQALSGGAAPDAALVDTLSAIAYSVVIVVAAWAVTWGVERWIGPLRRRVALWIGVALAAVAIFAAAGGIVYADIRTGGLDEYLGDRWEEFTSDEVGSTEGGSRFAAVGLNGRLQQWKVAGKAFAEEPALGLGAQNFEYYWYQHRTTLLDVRQPHSQPMQLLSELGVPGVVLWIAFVLGLLVRAMVIRFRSTGRANQAVVAALITAAVSWFIHSSADWLWQLAGVSLPAMMLLGGLAGLDGRLTPTTTAAWPAKRSYRSVLVRAAAALLVILALGSALFPYLSQRYSDLGAGSATIEGMTARTKTAAALDPTTVTPFAVRADAHGYAATQAPDGSSERLQQLRLVVSAWQDAIDREPGDWLYHYKATEALMAAADAARASGSDLAEGLAAQARTYLAEARRLSPLSPQLDALEVSLRERESGPVGIDTPVVE